VLGYLRETFFGRLALVLLALEERRQLKEMADAYLGEG
jgi:hypothetical protein